MASSIYDISILKKEIRILQSKIDSIIAISGFDNYEELLRLSQELDMYIFQWLNVRRTLYETTKPGNRNNALSKLFG